ncbi:MAG: radical SAM protein, partial [Armatimonadetes bacterium]|nr:radical SAM protein [Armatimonadota bacterium]
GTWLELANLVVPGYNDNTSTFRKMCQWILDSLSPDVPLFVSRFFPKYQLRRVQATSQDTLRNLRKLAYEVGLNYVYLGNLPGDPAESTYCPACGMKVLKRHGPQVTNTGLDPRTGKCTKCGCKIPGIWQA